MRRLDQAKDSLTLQLRVEHAQDWGSALIQAQQLDRILDQKEAVIRELQAIKLNYRR